VSAKQSHANNDKHACKGDTHHQVSKLGSRIAARFAKVGLNIALPEFRDQVPRAVKFTK
jgi:hypothetical protein